MERNFDNQLFAQQLVLNATKRYEKEKKKRNITVWLVVSVLIFWLLNSSSDSLSILLCVGLSLLFGLIICVAGVIMVTLISTSIFNVDERKAELLRLQQKYVEKYGNDNFYYDHINKGA